jgi:hypothetical protein
MVETNGMAYFMPDHMLFKPCEIPSLLVLPIHIKRIFTLVSHAFTAPQFASTVNADVRVSWGRDLLESQAREAIQQLKGSVNEGLFIP